MLTALRYASRRLRQSPAFALTAILTLALGIGATTAIFSVVNSILLNPAGMPEPDRLVAVRVKYDKVSHLQNIGTSAADYKSAREDSATFSHVATMQFANFSLTGGDRPERLIGARVSSSWFATFQVKPILGRDFRPEEDQPGATQVVILAYPTWKNRFGGDPAIVGKTLMLNGQPHRVAGVIGPEFRWPSRAELWAPIGLTPDQYRARTNQFLFTLARLKPGVSLEQASSRIRAMSDQIAKAELQGNDGGWGIFLRPLNEQVTGNLRAPLLVLLGAVTFVLLIACSNIAGLLLARASGRAKEMTIRAALGAGRWHLIRQSLTESGLLAALGGVLGIGIAFGGVRMLTGLAEADMNQQLNVQLDRWVMLFTLGATALAGLWFGLAPAWSVSGIQNYEGLKEGGRSGTASRARQQARGVLVVGQVALALVLLVGAGLFIRSIGKLREVDTGFKPAGVLTAFYTLPEAQYRDEERQIAFHQALMERLRTVPGVRAAAGAIPLPFSGDNWSGSFEIDGKPTPPGQPSPHGDQRYVTPGYFEAMNIPLRAGRYFTDQDRKGSEEVVIIDDLLAKTYFPNEDPIGRKFVRGRGANRRVRTIVGVVGHVRHNELQTDTKGAYFYSAYQSTPPMMAIVMQPSSEAAGRAAVLEAIRGVDPNQPIYDIKTMDERVTDSLGTLRFGVKLIGSFATLALLMAAIGLYGLISYAVTQRTQEIGIRMALGAARQDVLTLVLGQGVKLLIAGVALGSIAAYALARLIATQLFGVKPFDPLTFGVMAGVLALVALLAAYVPARRALSVDPMIALRYE